MKKIIVVLLLLPISGFAGKYEDAARVELHCKHFGEVARLSFDYRDNPRMLKAHKDTKAELESTTTPDPLKLLIYEVDENTYHKAGTAEDAYQVGWAKCMDSYAEGKLKLK